MTVGVNSMDTSSEPPTSVLASGSRRTRDHSHLEGDAAYLSPALAYIHGVPGKNPDTPH